MNKNIEVISERKSSLSRQIEMQRNQLASEFQPLRSTMHYADYGMKAVRFLGDHPVLATSAAALIAYVMPRRWLKAIQRGLLPWGLSLAAKFALKDRTGHHPEK